MEQDHVLQVDDDLFLALKPEQHVKQAFSSKLAPDAYLAVETSVTTAARTMQLIDEFCTRLSVAYESRDKNKKRVLILTGNNDDEAVTTASMLLGSFLILQRGLAVGAVMTAFHALRGRFVPLTSVSPSDDKNIVSVQACWRALSHGLRLGWFVPPSSDDEPVLDVGELEHYASAANGGVQMVAPGALLFFPTPSDDISDGQEWADSISAEGTTTRSFGPSYYASLLADLGVSAVACLGRGSAGSAQAFAARSVAPLDLRLLAPAHGADAYAAGTLLPALDRLITLARGAPGAVAVHIGSGSDWPASSLSMLAAAFLIRRFGFPGEEAAAWVHMVAPNMLSS
jgi:hypothetical protein